MTFVVQLGKELLRLSEEVQNSAMSAPVSKPPMNEAQRSLQVIREALSWARDVQPEQRV
jgi:hypothetical protein